MQPLDPKLQELYVRWFQFGSVSPLMRLHGHRNGGPPSDPVCMQVCDSAKCDEIRTLSQLFGYYVDERGQ